MRLLKKSLLVLVLLFIGMVAYCQPRPPQNPQVGDISNVGLHRNPQTPEAPIAPATLLLIGMGATAVGVKLYRNSKQQ